MDSLLFLIEYIVWSAEEDTFLQSLLTFVIIEGDFIEDVFSLITLELSLVSGTCSVLEIFSVDSLVIFVGMIGDFLWIHYYF